MDSILTEWNEDEYRDYLREEARLEGKIEGKIEKTIEMCREFGVSKEDTRERIIREFSLQKEEAQKYMKEYWK